MMAKAKVKKAKIKIKINPKGLLRGVHKRKKALDAVMGYGRKKKK